MWAVSRNIERAREVGRELWMLGFPTLVPHANTAMMDGPGTDEIFLRGDLVMMERCDLVVVLPGWERSSGTRAEIARAHELGIPVYYWPCREELIRLEATC